MSPIHTASSAWTLKPGWGLRGFASFGFARWDSLLLLSGESVRQREGNVQQIALWADNVARMMKYHRGQKRVLYF